MSLKIRLARAGSKKRPYYHVVVADVPETLKATIEGEGIRALGFVPLTADGLAAAKRLGADGIATNVTLCFSPTQAILAAKAGATYVSPFLGRLDDISADGVALLAEICEIYRVQGYETKVLAASLRHPQHVVQAALTGADVATMPYETFHKLVKHPLTDAGLERFLADWRSYQEAQGGS
jgi:transaldolase